MTYKLVVTKRADELTDHIISHLLYRLKHAQAARHLLSEIEAIYLRLEENPRQFPLSKDPCLARKKYHEAFLCRMNYKILFQIREDTVYIAGMFHHRENYSQKLSYPDGDQPS